MEQVYYDPSHPAALGGVGRFSSSVGKPHNATTRWLESQPTYTLHKPARSRGYPTRPYRTKKTDYQWQADLVEMIPWAKENNGFKYILTVIDIFSRYALAEPLKNKTPEVIKAFKKIFQSGRKPLVYADRSGERI